MSFGTDSLAELQTVGKFSLDDSLYKSFSMSSTSVNRGGRFGNKKTEEAKVLPKASRRPVRIVRPVSAVSSACSFPQMNHLQGELVRKRKECEDLKKENKFLLNEIHMERIMMRTESELTMRSLRNLNQDQQAQLKELKQKLYQSQQRATLCSRAADEAEESKREAEQSRALAEARALACQRDKETAEADRRHLNDEMQLLKKEVQTQKSQHTNLQLLLAQTEKNYFESMLKLERVSGEKEALMQENKSLSEDRDELRLKLRKTTQENTKIKDSEMSLRHKVTALEEESKRASQAQREAEAERRLVEKERQERAAESLSWREKHQELTDVLRAQEDLKAQRQNKACQANIKSYFLCMTESDQRVKILKNPDGEPRNFTEGDPIFISTTESSLEESEGSSSRTILRISAPQHGRDLGPSHFADLPAIEERPSSAPSRRSKKVVEYFWIPTDEE